jgi:hypothetical protein
LAKGRLARLFPCPQGKIFDVPDYKTRLNRSECYIFHTTKTSKFGHRNVKISGCGIFSRKKLRNTRLPVSSVVAPKNTKRVRERAAAGYEVTCGSSHSSQFSCLYVLSILIARNSGLQFHRQSFTLHCWQ